MDVEMWPVGQLKPSPANPRDNDAGVDAVAASLREFGFRRPIVVDEQDVIGVGHTRYKAALKLGLIADGGAEFAHPDVVAQRRRGTAAA